MTEAACDQSKSESAIQGLCTNFVCEFILVPPLKSFCKQAMIKRISKQILQTVVMTLTMVVKRETRLVICIKSDPTKC